MEDTLAAVSWVLIALYSVAVVYATWTIYPRTPKKSQVVQFIGGTMLFVVACLVVHEHANAREYTVSCINSLGNGPAVTNVSSYGYGPERHLVLVNLTEIGGAANIHDDDKEHAVMQTYVNGTMQQEHHIGVEVKGSHVVKFSLGIETWDDEWEDKNTQFAEFGFTGEYEDYVIRADVLHDRSFLSDYANALAQPRYYEAQMVELLLAVGDSVTYEGVYMFVNNPVKKDSIPDANKLKESRPLNETTYIVEYEWSTDESCGLAGHPELECKYPKPSKFAEDERASPTSYLERVLSFDEPALLNFTSLAEHFLLEQLYLETDMQKRSVVYHVNYGQLQGGPSWDPNEPLWDVDSGRLQQWVVHKKARVPFASEPLDWWETWLDTYPEFSRAVRTSGSALQGYWEANQAAYAYLKDTFPVAREQARWPCVEFEKQLGETFDWRSVRHHWMQDNVAGFHASDVVYVMPPWGDYMIVAIVGTTLIVLASAYRACLREKNGRIMFNMVSYTRVRPVGRLRL